MSDTRKYVQGQDYFLAGSGIGITDTSIILTSLALPNSGELITMTMFGTLGQATLEPETNREENISFTGITQNDNGTATLTGITRGLKFVDPYTQTLSLRRSHSGSTLLRFTNSAPFYDGFTNKGDDETITGDWTFSNHSPTVPTEISSEIHRAASIEYVNNIAISGAPDASTTVKGISKLSTAPVSPTNPISVGTNDNRVSPVSLATVTAGQVAALPGNNTDIAVGSGNLYITQTGLQHNVEKYAVDTSGSSTVYVAALSPVPTSLTTGMVVYVKIVNANTTSAPTLTLTGTATAKTIVKFTNTALSAGDIGANSFNTFIYDGTNFVLQNPIATISIPQLYSVNADETIGTYHTFSASLAITSANGWTATNISGGALGIGSQYATMTTNTTGSGFAGISGATIPGVLGNSTWTTADGKAIRIKVRLKMSAVTASNFTGFGLGSTGIISASTDTTAGVKIINDAGVLYAQNANGTATRTNISSGITLTNWNLYEIVFSPGVDIKFYVNGTLVATHTTNLPSGFSPALTLGTNGSNTNTIEIAGLVISEQL